MRKISIVLFVMLNLVQHLAIAQDYLPFPDSGAVWVNYNYTVELDPFYHNVFIGADKYCVNGQDTLINSITYTKLNYCEGIYKTAIRSDNGKVYFVPPDSVNELLLYDFTVEQGDTLNDYYNFRSEPERMPETIIGPIDSININGIYHKRIEMPMGHWIEGIGCTAGLFYEPLPNVSFAAYELYCMSQNDTTLYPQVSYSSCLQSVSDNYVSLFGDSSTTWDIIQEGACDYICSGTYIVNGDTLVDTIDYKKIWGLPGFLREDTLQGKAWFYNSYYEEEYLVMDMGLNPGDTFNFYDWNNVAQPFIADSVYYLNSLKHIRLNAWTRMCGLDEAITFIEGSGTTAGFDYQRIINGDQVSQYMLCHHKDGMKVADNNLFPGQCYVCSIGIYENTGNTLSLYPNPATTQLTITGYTPAYLKLCNTLGQTVAEASNSTTLLLGNLPQGLYVLQLFDAKGALVKAEKVVKE